MNGILNVLKPPGMTSSDVVVDLRRLLGIKRIGHAGTLDPGAAGVLPVCIGKATRLFDFLAEKDKEYLCEITFGAATDTIDAYGSVVARDSAVVTEEQFRAALAAFEGEQEQIPPLYSALKFNGQKLCDLARKGETVAPPEKRRRIVMHALRFVEQTGENSFLFFVHCSKGTYIRTLCADIAASLGTCAYMSFLLRTRSGSYTLEHAHTLAELAALKEQGALGSVLVAMGDALPNLFAVDAPPTYAASLAVGNPVPLKDVSGAYGAEPLRVFCAGRFFGIGRAEGDLLKMKAVLLDEHEQEISATEL